MLLFLIMVFAYMEHWPSGYGAGFPIQGFRVQYHWVVPKENFLWLQKEVDDKVLIETFFLKKNILILFPRK